eukprot:SAG22_NODE_587_length_8857_cov_5.973167_5_plen_132_part_00
MGEPDLVDCDPDRVLCQRCDYVGPLSARLSAQQVAELCRCDSCLEAWNGGVWVASEADRAHVAERRARVQILRQVNCGTLARPHGCTGSPLTGKGPCGLFDLAAHHCESLPFVQYSFQSTMVPRRRSCRAS